MDERTRGLLLVGVGGQGVILASNIVASVLLRAGHDVKKSEVHGMAQRGGVVYSHIRFGPAVASPLVERGGAEVLLAFEWAESLRWLRYLDPGGMLVAGVDRIVPPIACTDRRTWASGYPPVDGSWLSERVGDLRLVDARAVASRLGNPKAANSVLLGVLSGALAVPVSAWHHAIREGVPPRTVEVNLEAFRAGREMPFPASYPRGEEPAGPAPRVPPDIRITPQWCKGCDICVRFCPQGCLALDAQGKVTVVDEDACTGCRLCELLCPDFAIAVAPRERRVVTVSGGSDG